MDAIRVLIADTQRLFSGALALALEHSSDFDVLTERPDTGPQAVDAVELFRPDVALVDYWLESMDGPIVTMSVRAVAPSCKVLITSWIPSVEQLDRALSAGARGFIPKSYGIARVAEAIRRAHHGEYPVFASELIQMRGRIAARHREAGKFEEAVKSLSPRELQVLMLLSSGHLTEEISRELNIASSTVNAHINSILKKTRTGSQAELLARARDAGVI